MQKLTQSELKKHVHYDPITGIFTRKNKIIGFPDRDGYIKFTIKGKHYLAHRLAWLYMKGYLPEHEVDHKDRIPYNNKWKNLRESTHSCNMKNKKIYKNNKSGITGISWCKYKNKWKVEISVESKRKNIGYFINLIDAAKARWEAEKKYNFPDCNTTSSALQYLNQNSPYD
jgi:hypothetical protein